MNDLERRDDLPGVGDSVASTPEDTTSAGDDIKIVVTEETDGIAGDDGVRGAESDDAPEERSEGEPNRPRSRFARERQKWRQERDQIAQVATTLQNQLQQVAAERQALLNQRFAAERDAVENRFHYLQAIGQQLTAAKKAAMEAGDSNAIAEIDQRQMSLAPEMDRVAHRRQQYANYRPVPQQQVAQPQYRPLQQRAAPQRLHETAERWAEHQTAWLEADGRRVAAARAVAQNIEAEGLSPDEPEYYDRLNSGLRSMFSDFRPYNPAAARSSASTSRTAGMSVAGVDRSSATTRPRGEIRVAPNEYAAAKRLGINLEDPKQRARFAREYREFEDQEARKASVRGNR